MKNKRVAAIMGGVAGILALSIFAIFFLNNDGISKKTEPLPPESPCEQSGTPATLESSSAQTIGWKTYANTKCGFRFEYPDYYDLFQQTPLAVNRGDIYLERMDHGGFRVSYKTKITALSSVRAESHQENIGELRVNVYNLNSYRISNIPAGIEFGFDSNENQWWEDRGEGQTASALLPKVSVGNDLVGYKIGIGDAGEGFKYVLIPIVSKDVMVEILFYQGIGATQSAPIETILSTFKLI